MERKTYDTNDMVNIVVDLYNNPSLKRYILPSSGAFRGRGRGGREIGRGPNASVKSKQAEYTDSVMRTWVHDSCSLIPNNESLQNVLQKASLYKFAHINNNVKVDVKELKEVIDVLGRQINNLIKQNNDDSLNDEISKKEQELQVLQETLERKSIDQYNCETDMAHYNDIALKVLKILHANDEKSYQMYNLIRSKLLPNEKQTNTQPNHDGHTFTNFNNNSTRWGGRPPREHGNNFRPQTFGFRPKRDQNASNERPRYEPRYVPPHAQSHFEKNKVNMSNYISGENNNESTDYEKMKYTQQQVVQQMPNLESLPTLETSEPVQIVTNVKSGAWTIPLSQKVLQNDGGTSFVCKPVPKEYDNSGCGKFIVDDEPIKKQKTSETKMEEPKSKELNWGKDISEW